MKKSRNKKGKAPKAVLPPLSPGQRIADLMMDVIACVLISAGACLALFGLYEFPFSWLSVLLLTAGCTGAIALLSRKWWSLTTIPLISMAAASLAASKQSTFRRKPSGAA